jgi:hypothetical protein
MCTITKKVKHCKQCFWPKQVRLDKLVQPGWSDAANYFCERDIKYGTSKLNVAAVVNYKLDMTAATPSPTTFGDHM